MQDATLWIGIGLGDPRSHRAHETGRGMFDTCRRQMKSLLEDLRGGGS